MKNLKIGVKIAGGFGAVLFLALVMSLMVLLGNISIQNAVTNSGFASELQIAGMEVLSAYSVLKDDVATLEMSDDDAAYARAVEHLKQCKLDITAMQGLSQSTAALNHFQPLLEELSGSFDAWGKSIDELQASNKRLETIVTETYKSGEMLSNRSRIVFDMQMEEVAVEAGQDLTALQRIDRIKYIRDGQKIADDIANGRRELEVILMTYDMEAFDDALQSLKATLSPIREYLAAAKTDADRTATQSLETRVMEYCDYVVAYSHEIELAQTCIADENRYSENVLRNLNTLLAELDAESTYQAGVTLDASQLSLVIVMASAALALLFGILIAMFIVRSVTKPIEEMVIAAGRIAEGDVDIHLEVDSNDEIGTLARAFKNMIEGIRQQVRYMEQLSAGDMSFKVFVRSDKDVMNLGFKKLCENMSDVFVRLKGTAASVAQTASDIAHGSQALADGTSQQADNIRDLSASLDEISKQTKENSGLAVKASDLGNKIKEDAERGSVQMDHMVSAVAEITEASRSISSVMKIIDDIAFQTNILALNAAVEAARAGQQGKGFAVVADEVRSLASKSAEAAHNTGAMIENSIKKAELGAEIAMDTSESLKKIVEGIIESSGIVGTIAQSSEAQSQSMERINESIGSVSNVIHTNTATSEQSAAAADMMKNQSQELNRLISEFKLAEGN